MKLLLSLIFALSLSACTSAQCGYYHCYAPQKESMRRAAYASGSSMGSYLGSGFSGSSVRPVRPGWILRPAYNAWLNQLADSFASGLR